MMKSISACLIFFLLHVLMINKNVRMKNQVLECQACMKKVEEKQKC